MTYWIVAFSVFGILCTGVVWGTDVFFLMVGRAALRSASASAGTELMAFMHMFADARMPIFGAAAIVSQLLLVVFTAPEKRWFYGASLVALLLFVIVYSRLSKPINRLQTEAATKAISLDNARELQAAWERPLTVRVPVLALSLLAQCLALLVDFA